MITDGESQVETLATAPAATLASAPVVAPAIIPAATRSEAQDEMKLHKTHMT